MESFFETGEGVCSVCGRAHNKEEETWTFSGLENDKLVCFKVKCIKAAEELS